MIEYTLPKHLQFVEDMEKAGLKIELYHGRSWWHGPSVIVSDLPEAMSHTKILCQWDNIGTRYVVYPKANDPSLEGLNDLYENEE